MDHDDSEIHVDDLSAVPASVRLYGARGQAQQGIDIFARDPWPLGQPAPDRPYVCLQSRRIERVSAAKMRAAVKDFLAGSFAATSRTFIYATSAPAVRTEHAAAIEELTRSLASVGIVFAVWDQEEISNRLRELPRLVDDFFGRAWVEQFCGHDAAISLGVRLDGAQVAELRSALRGLYSAAFDIADSGQVLLSRGGLGPSPLMGRFVPLDLIPVHGLEELLNASSYDQLDEAGSDVATTRDERVDAFLDDTWADDFGRYPSLGSVTGDWLPPQFERPIRHGDNTDRAGATPAPNWVGTSPRQIVVGDPGTGKSTLLRCLVLDLLDPNPRWTAAAANWGDRLPIWLPFHYFTQRVAATTGSGASVVRAIRAWFEQNDFDHLMPLVDLALQDDRLLLVVDGLDEWATLRAGEYAAAALETFVSARPVAIVMSSRPYGLDRVTLAGQWSHAYTAPLTPSQQRQMAWPQFERLVDGSNHHSALLEKAVDDFMSEIAESVDLQALAAVPLFLVLLAGLKSTSSGTLPQRRFDVFDKAIRLLVTEHPSRRRVAAAVTLQNDDLDDRQLRIVFAQVAFAAQERGDLRTLDDTQLKADLLAALEDPDTLALDRATAIARADRILDVAEGDLGLLVRMAPGQLGFIHRSLQEQLAAEHVVRRLSHRQTVLIFQARLEDRRWREVLLAILWLTDRPDELRELVDVIRSGIGDTVLGLATADLLAEVVYGPYGVPGDFARAISASIVERLERHPVLSHRADLLKHVVGGTRDAIVGPSITGHVTEWGVTRHPPGAHLVRRLLIGAGTHQQPFDADVAEAALNNLDAELALAASNALLTRLMGSRVADSAIRDVAQRTLADPVSDTAAAAALALLCRGWVDDSETAVMVEHYRDSQSTAVRAVALAHLLGVLECAMGEGRPGPTVTPDRLTEVEIAWLKDASGRSRPGPYVDIVRSAVAVLLRGDLDARDRIVNAIERGVGRDLDLAWTIGLRAFADDARFAEATAEHLATQKYPLPLRAHGSAETELADVFDEDNPHRALIADAIERRLDTFDERYRDVELARLAAIDRGPRMTQTLLTQLEDSSFPHWAAGALVTYFTDDPR